MICIHQLKKEDINLKKKILIITLIVGSIAFLILGPISFRTVIPSSYNSHYNVETEMISMEIKKNTLTKTGATIIIKNHTDNYCGYGGLYFIEHKMFDHWFYLKPKGLDFRNYTMNIKPLEPHSESEITINWGNFYGPLSKGKYRIIQETVTNTRKENDEYSFVEFEIK